MHTIVRALRSIARARFLVAAGGVAILLTAGGVTVAAAHGGRPLHTDAIEGAFSFNTVHARQRTCQGQDGTYLEIVVKQAGAAEGDARVSGDLELNSHILLNPTVGGTSEGRFVVRDAATGRRKAAGEFLGVITPAAPPPDVMFALHGLLVGTVFDDGVGPEETAGSGRVVANFNALFDAQLNGTGRFGTPGDSPYPTVIQGGRCGGHFRAP